MNVFVTGFGPFLGNDDNPSAALAESCGLPFAVLSVTFRAVEEFLVSAPEFDALLMLGLASGEQDPRLRLELVARNVVGPTPDAEGVVGGPGPIAPFA
ncbi:MAG: pyroglutamyl-peptidase I, partial [Fimbriimonadaceae bacterium]|nr:pyroglutamyl-peptidase I [Fimbriimonadaceae bacterium]